MKPKSRLIVSALGALVVLILLEPLAVEAAEAEYRLCPTDSTCTIGEFLYDDNYTPVPPANASCTLTIRKPDGGLLFDPPPAMSESADGWYYYDFDTTGKSEGLYRSTMCCDVGTEHLCLDKSFTIGPDVAGAVWNAPPSSYNTPGTFGWYLQNATGLAQNIWSYTSRSLTDFGSLVADIWNNTIRSLTTRQISPTEHIAREEEHWTTRFAGGGEVLAGKTYRAKLWVLNFETELADAVADPTYTIYDAMRNVIDSPPPTGTMTKLAGTTGIYELTYIVPTNATGGRWETIVDVDVDGGGTDIQDGSYWEVESSPAEVKINAITDNTVPSITANVTIKNEGGSWYEYKYAYCVVAQENNTCGGGDDVFYKSGSKKLNAGQSWTTNFNATVPNPGQYWFKVVVQWGTEKSGASQVFMASKVTCLGDYNSDGYVNLTDFSIMLYYWKKYSPTHDLSGDGYVNLTDFSIMLYYWGKCP